MVTIDKVDFERALPVGASSHEEVYLSVQGAIGEQLVCSTGSLLGEAGEKMVAEADCYPTDAAAHLHRHCIGTGGIGEIIRLFLHPRLAGADWNEYQECHRAGRPD